MTDVVVIGGGPAGAACALWLHQLGLDVMLLEAGECIGGLQARSPYLNRWMPGLQGTTGQQVAAQLQAHLVAEAVPHTVRAEVVSVRPFSGHDGRRSGWEVAVPGRTWGAPRVVIATGSTPRTGGFTESDCVGIGPGVSMERIAVHGRRVALLGGGDNAFDMAAFALRRGARSVDIYCRRTPRAQPLLEQAIGAQNVHVGPFEADQKSMTVNGRRHDVIGVQFGFDACIPAGLQLPLCDGAIEVDRHGAVAGNSGLFAAGEVTGFWHPCVTTAFAHGIQVAKSIQQAHAKEQEVGDCRLIAPIRQERNRRRVSASAIQNEPTA